MIIYLILLYIVAIKTAKANEELLLPLRYCIKKQRTFNVVFIVKINIRSYIRP